MLSGNLRVVRHRLFILMLVSVALKFWLIAAQPVVAHANASFDDRLFLALAEPILKGHWLGPYSQFTLMKGPMYSVIIAGAYLVRIPLPLAQHLLYLAGCGFLVLALRPCFTANWQSAALFTLLWWQPMSYVELDVLRQNIYTPLTLMVFAGLFALQTGRKSPLHLQLLWGILLGASAGAFYLTREEGIWITPAATLLVAWSLVSSWHAGREFWRTLRQLLIASAIAVAIVTTVCALNYRYYGWFGTVEFRAREFLSAYGALQRPIASEQIPYVPVTRDVRQRLYEVSPSFKELQSCLEGPVGQEWANYSDYLTGRPGEEVQIGGGSFMWALRDCVVSSGHANTARDALQFYRSIADEINHACDEGRAGPCRTRRDTMLPRYKSGQIQRLLQVLPNYAADFFLFRGFTAYPTESWGSADLLTLFQELTRWKLAPSTEAPEISSTTSRLDRLRLSMLQFIGNTVRWLCVAVVVGGIIAWILAAFRFIRRKRFSYLLMVATAAFCSALAVLAVNVLVNAIAFRNQGPTALHEGYPLLVLFGMTAWFALITETDSTATQESDSNVTG
jgi:hypothetical protein